MDRVRVYSGSRLWLALTSYYGEEMAREEPEAGQEEMLFALTTMVIEEVWRIDEYTPEPEDY